MKKTGSGGRWGERAAKMVGGSARLRGAAPRGLPIVPEADARPAAAAGPTTSRSLDFGRRGRQTRVLDSNPSPSNTSLGTLARLRSSLSLRGTVARSASSPGTKSGRTALSPRSPDKVRDCNIREMDFEDIVEECGGEKYLILPLTRESFILLVYSVSEMFLTVFKPPL